MRLFLSYAHVDKGRVADLANVLIAGGFETWWDDGLEPGDDWKGELRRRIAACDAFVCVVSVDSIESEWCQWELAQASILSKHIVPIVVREGVAPPATIAHLQYLDVSGGLTGPDVARLVGKLARLGQVGMPGAGLTASNPRGIPSRFVRPLPRTYRTVAQAYLQAQSPATPTYEWLHEVEPATEGSGAIVGVDFGSTVSSLAVARSGVIELIPNDSGETATLSAVAIAEDGTPLVGERAFNLILRCPHRGMLEVKRLLGNEPAREIGGTPILDVDGIGYSPIDLAAFVLRQLREDAEAFLGRPTTKAVLTSPAYFDHSQLAALIGAADRAGFDVIRVISEPVAACMGLNLPADGDSRILVYDLGGGTFDVSVVEYWEGVYEVKAVNGDTHLGGADFDRVLVDYCIDDFQETNGIDLRDNAEALIRIRDAAERAKVILSTARDVTVSVPFVTLGTGGPLHLATRVTRTRYHELTHQLVDRTIQLTKLVLDDAGVAIGDIDQLLVVGRAARAPSVRIALGDLFGRHFKTAPDHIVAQGAAVQAGVLGGQQRDYLLLDSTSRTLRVQLDSTTAAPVIVRHTTIPERRSVSLVARRPTESMRVRVLVGESSWVDQNTALLELNVPSATHCDEQPVVVTLTLDLDANSHLDATVRMDDGRSVRESLRLRQPAGDIHLASPGTPISEWTLPTRGDRAELAPLTLAEAGDRHNVQRWLAKTVRNLLVARAHEPMREGEWPELSAVVHENLFRDFPFERELVVDALEQRFRTDFAALRSCASIAAMAERLVNALQSLPR